RRYSPLRSDLAVRLPSGRAVRGVLHPRLSLVHTRTRTCRPLRVDRQDAPEYGPPRQSVRLLGLGRHLLHPLWSLPRQESRRISDRAARRWPCQPGLLFQPLAYWLSLVGHRLPRLMGLGPVLPL